MFVFLESNVRSDIEFFPRHSLLFKLYQKYPDRPVFVKVYTTKAPVFTSRRSGTNVTVTGNVEVYVTAKNGASVYALTVGLVSFVIHRKLLVTTETRDVFRILNMHFANHY